MLPEKSELLFGELIEQLDSLEDNIEKLSKEITRIGEAMNREQEDIDNYTELLNTPNSFNAYAFEKAAENFNEHAKEALMTNFMTAVGSVEEYNHPFFISQFKEIFSIKDANLFIVDFDSGFNLKYITDNLDEYAGTLEQYAAAVAAAKEELGIIGATRGKPRTDNANKYDYEVNLEDLASTIWYNKYYLVDRSNARVYRFYAKKSSRQKKGAVKVGEKEYIKKDVTSRYKGKYWKTMRARESAYIKPAPWWRLLEHGNSGMPGMGELPAGPKHSATNFVSKTVNGLKKEWDSFFAENKGKLEAEIRSHVRIAKANLATLEKYLEEAESRVFEDTPEFELSLEKVTERLMKLDKYERSDPVKLKKLAYDLSQGLATEGRRRIGGGVNPRLIELRRDIEAEIETMMEERYL